MSRKKRMFAAVVAVAGLVLGAGAAQAINSVDIVWRGFGSTVEAPTTVTASSILIADIVLTADTAGISGAGVSIQFDAAELEYLSGVEFTSVNLPGMGNVFAPLQIGLTRVDNTAGVIEGFEQADLSGVGLVASTRTLGSMKFHVKPNPSYGPDTDIDIIANSNGLADGFVNSVGGQLANPVVFNGASVTPEPTTAVLVLAGLAGLGYAGRRSLR
jgi:hypothetical protein